MCGRGSKVLVAANLRSNAALMPHYTLQLAALLAALPRGAAFLSIYESGSTDDTGATVCGRGILESNCTNWCRNMAAACSGRRCSL